MTYFHLDDEALSAVLDGEATPDEAAHAGVCAACGGRLAELRDAALLVGAAVPPPEAARREAAIATALDAARAETSVIPLRRHLPPAWLAAAAAAVVVVAAVGLLSRGGGDGKTPTASGATDATALAESAPDAFALAAPVDGGDLGDVAQVDLRPAISEALNHPQAATAAGAAAPAAGGAASDSSGRIASISCDPEVHAGHPDLGPLVFHAVGTLDGERVVVLAYDVALPDGSVERWVFVRAIDGCALRDQQRFAA